MKSLLEFTDRYCAFDHCRLPMPWFVWYRRTDAASVLRRRIMAMNGGPSFQDAGIGSHLIAAALHPPRVIRELLFWWIRKGGECKKGFGISRTRQLATLFYAVFRYNFPPSLYYRARLFRLPHDRWLSVFSHSEVMIVVPVIERHTEHLDVWSKQGWNRFCRQHQLPAVPTLACVSGGQLSLIDSRLPDSGLDLFIKPDRGWASRGTTMLEWLPAQNGWQATGSGEGFVPKADLQQFILNVSGGADVIVQPRLRTHPALADLATRALINFRVVTIRSPAGKISLFSAALRIPWHTEHCSDVAEGFYVPVNMTDGTLGYAEGLDMSPGPLASHPLTQAPIHGRAIPQWPDMQAQALAAHALLPSVPAIGWDLVATESGVLILEANVAWSTNLTQLRGLAPLGESDWPAAMIAYLDEFSSGETPR